MHEQIEIDFFATFHIKLVYAFQIYACKVYFSYQKPHCRTGKNTENVQENGYSPRAS